MQESAVYTIYRLDARCSTAEIIYISPNINDNHVNKYL